MTNKIKEKIEVKKLDPTTRTMKTVITELIERIEILETKVEDQETLLDGFDPDSVAEIDHEHEDDDWLDTAIDRAIEDHTDSFDHDLGFSNESALANLESELENKADIDHEHDFD